MREGAHSLAILFTFWCWGLLQAEGKNEESPQTFVVRYKNGKHTIPVTVVLDYKKQTEYVINMSPRAATKTVTLYDFKQKTIAYKDLTNRECFLGRLTHESLSEETDALNKIQNPVEGRSKVLSLDPHRSSLTPTEILNMAGQKMAVFCRKMSTWLILPKGTHTLQKREAEEVEERTFHHQGYHTIQYSHFGRETLRRYRKPGNRQFLQDRIIGSVETASENLPKSPSVNYSVLNPSPTGRTLNGSSQNVHHPRNPALKNGVEDLSTVHSVNRSSGKEGFSTVQNEYELQLPMNHTTHHNEVGSNDRKETLDKKSPSVEDFKIALENEESASFVLKKEPNYLEGIETKLDTKRNTTLYLNGDTKQMKSEDKIIPFSLNVNRNASEGNILFEDASRILQTTEKPLDQPLIMQTDEDVHDLFEGFFNLQKNDRPSEEIFYSSISPETNHEKDKKFTDGSLINSHQNLSPTRIKYDPSEKQQSKKNDLDSSNIAEIDKSTNHFNLPTHSYSNYNGVTISPLSWNGPSGFKTLKNKSESLGNSTKKVDHSSKSITIELSKPVSSKDENISSGLVDEYFATDNPLEVSTDKKYSDLSKFTNTFENFTSGNFTRRFQKNMERHNLFPSGIYSQQLRLQNALRNYKPDHIIIDVENIPTHSPPESTLGFQSQVHVSGSPNLSRNFGTPEGEQTSGDTWRRPPIRKTHIRSRKMHSFHGSSPQHRRNESNVLQHNSNIQQSSLQPLNYPTYNARGAYKLNILPSDVSIHPRHPKAPYADTVLKGIHLQRHRKKKYFSANSCCRSRGKAKSCCRSCCSFPGSKSKQRARRVQTRAPQQKNKLVEDPRSPCQKERLCRTLYESTHQVMVCRNAKIDGC